MMKGSFETYLSFIFQWIIETSVMASVLVGLILLVKALLRSKLTPRWHYILWMTLLVRLLLPWSIDSKYSMYSLLLSGYKATVSGITTFSDSEHVGEMEHRPLIVQDKTISTQPTTPQPKAEFSLKNEQTGSSFSLYTLASYIWLIGVFLLGSTTYIANRRLHDYIQQQPAITEEKVVQIFYKCKKVFSIRQDIPLLLAGKLASPTVFGFFRPRLLLSAAHLKHLNEQQLQHIFYHELAHVKRKDVGVNWLMYSLLLVNWFNPILWYAYFRMREDQELACDSLALSYMNARERKAYGHTIISLLEHYSKHYQVPALANLSGNKKTVRRRILMIKRFQRKSYRWSTLGVTAALVVASLSFLNVHADEPSQPKQKQVPLLSKTVSNNNTGETVERVTPEESEPRQLISVDMSQTVTTFGMTYKVNSVKRTKTREMLPVMGDRYDFVKVDQQGTILNNYSYIIVNVTVKNNSDKPKEVNLNSGTIYAKNQNGEYKDMFEPLLFDKRNDIYSKDYFRYVLQPKEASTFNIGFAGEDASLDQYKDNLDYVINNGGMAPFMYDNYVRIIKINYN